MPTWKDTVMSNEQLEEEIRKDYEGFSIKEQSGEIEDILMWTREAQAENSFEAGQEAERKNSLEYANELRRYYEEKIGYAKDYGYQMGIREVAGWLQQNCKYEIEAGIEGRELAAFVIVDWQAKLKELSEG